MPASPLVSIITVTYNASLYIESTIQSIIDLKDESVEFIVIDGNSNDGTIEIIKKYLDFITFFQSKPDKGIYDAMNIAIQQSKGIYLYFINCGDQLLNFPKDILKEFEAREHQILAFPIVDSNKVINKPKINSSIKIRNLLPHQGCFYKRNLDISYNLKYRVFADFDLHQRLYRNNIPFRVFDQPIIASHDLGGISHEKKFGKEVFRVVRDNFGIGYSFLSFIYFKLTGIRRRLKI